jgi:uncharacterized membrane protein YbhN (UPF0104 family)
MSALSSSDRPLVGNSAPARRREQSGQRRRLKVPRVGRRIATMALAVVLLVALLASVPALRGVLHEIRHIGAAWVLAAVALELGSALSFVVVFRLFFDRVPAREARSLAWTEQGSGALLPGGGAGGLAIGAVLIRLTGAPLGWIVRRSAGLFFLGGLMSSLALVGGGVALIAGAAGPHDFLRVVLPTTVAAAGTLLIAVLPPLVASRRRVPRWLGGLATGVREAEVTLFTRRPSWRLLGAVGYLGFDIAVLWVTLRALGHVPSIPVVMLAYSIGYAANLLPVPGGVGVLDAGLTGALVLYGVSPVHAAAAVIIYHAIAFWIPGLGGVFAYLRLRPRLLGAATPASGAATPASVSATNTPLEGGNS